MANERLTEEIVRDHFKNDALFKSVKWEEQKSSNKRIAELLKGESKGGGKGNGYPEFIVSFPTNSNYLIVVECKAKTNKHRSAKLDNAKDYAVDGVLHYAHALSAEFNVIAIAVSGENTTEMLVSHFYFEKNARNYTELPISKLNDIASYLKLFEDHFFLSDFIFRDIANKARELNEELYQYSIKELSRCTIISAILLALTDDDFANRYESIPTIKELGTSIISAIDTSFLAESKDDDRDIVRNASLLHKEFEGILKEPLFSQKELSYDKGKKKDSTLTIVKELIIYLKKNVYPLVKHDSVGYDVIGLFYTEFIRYAGSEQSLGLVLTPQHITELFCDLAELRKDDIVYDPCCGTGGFIVAAIQRLFKLAEGDEEKRKHIKRKQICGCELRSDMYTYACSNMRFRGDGKSNLYNGDCFNNEITIQKNHCPTVAFLNPPYGKTVSCARQMEFVEHALNTINPQAEGRVVAIVQMSCAIKNEKNLIAVKKRLLQKHHLKAVLSMPDDLFYPVGVVTCIMVFEANKPNKGRKTWFGYFKDDGFEKRKNFGRIDVHDRYTAIKNQWLSAYLNLDEIPGLSVRQEVTAEDEWCAEAYMETDYSSLCDEDFIRKMRDYAAFLVEDSTPNEPFTYTNLPLLSNKLNLNTDTWKWFKVKDLFYAPYKATPYNAIELVNCSKEKENAIMYITRTDTNNGCKTYVEIENLDNAEKGNAITIGDTTATIYYQENEFICGDHMVVLRSKNLNKHIGLFIVSLLDKERFRYNYGRAFNKNIISKTKLKLPAILNADGNYEPDWQWMENYIKGLPYSGCL